jgi:hypothetical protein
MALYTITFATDSDHATLTLLNPNDQFVLDGDILAIGRGPETDRDYGSSPETKWGISKTSLHFVGLIGSDRPRRNNATIRITLSTTREYMRCRLSRGAIGTSLVSSAASQHRHDANADQEIALALTRRFHTLQQDEVEKAALDGKVLSLSEVNPS